MDNISARRPVAAVAIAAVLAAGGSLATTVASAGPKPVPSTIIDVRGSDGTVSPRLVYGTVSSSKSKKCVSGRRVKIFVQSSSTGPYKLVDTAKSSANGAWAGELPDGVPFAVKAVAPKSKYGPRHHRKSCDAASDKLFFV